MEIISKESLQSTNLYANQLLDSGEIKKPTLIVTDCQTAGKGYGKNLWESAPNQNLTFSLVAFPNFLSADNIFSISMAVSLAICQFLEQYIDSVSIKWPNDIYWKDKKIAGILIENALSGENIEYVIAGIGLNINQEVFETNPPNAVSLAQITGKKYNLSELLSVLAEIILLKIENLSLEEYDDFIKNYYKKMYRFQKNYEFRKNNEIFEAKIVGVNKWGNLILQKSDLTHAIFGFKEVEYII